MPQGLGRGLSSLIPKKVSSEYSDFSVSKDNSLEFSDKDRIHWVSPKKIVANPLQPRKDIPEASLEDLVKSIKKHGILQPLVVTRKDEGFELIAGERRLRSSMLLNLKEVPVIVREADQQKKLELALIENLQRENLNPVETAIAYNQLMNEFNLNQEEVAERLGKSRSSVANALRLLNLPAEIQLALIEKKITEAHAKYLLGLDGEVKRMNVFRKILMNNLSVRETDKLIKKIGGTKGAMVKTHYRDKEKEDRLKKHLDTKVEIRRRKQGGEIVITFFDDESLEYIVKKIF